MSFHAPGRGMLARRGLKPRDCSSPRASGKYCPECKLRVRGPNHKEGVQHKLRVK